MFSARLRIARKTLRLTPGLLSLCLLAACGPSNGSDFGVDQASFPLESTAPVGKYFYFQCNTTGWGVTQSNLMNPTATPGAYSITYNVTITYDDPCELMQSPQLYGWGNGPTYFGFAKPETIIPAPAIAHVMTLTSRAVDPHFSVKYPGTGTFTATFDTNAMTLTLSSGSSSGDGGGLTSLKHVLLLSIDGLHAPDLYNWVEANPRSSIAGLYAHGVEYPNASATTPSNGFPAMLALATGGTPFSTGVYDDDSYDRTLFAPGSRCTGTRGTEVVYSALVDEDLTQLSTRIDQASLPLFLNSTTNECTSVYPHQFLQDNTIFEIVKASGA